jgi:hypothetical protein
MSMSNGNGRRPFVVAGEPLTNPAKRVERLHSSWLAFIQYCAELQFGEIEKLKIQDGLPVLAEVVKEKIKFN